MGESASFAEGTPSHEEIGAAKLLSRRHFADINTKGEIPRALPEIAC
jgi:hypothetical protein